MPLQILPQTEVWFAYLTVTVPATIPHGMNDISFDERFTRDVDVIFTFQGECWLIHSMVHGRLKRGPLPCGRI